MTDFTAVDPEHPPHSPAVVFKWAVLDRLTGRRRIPSPGPAAPSVEPDRGRLERPSPAQLTWLGHASFLLQLAGRAVLVDPVLGGRLGVVYKRYTPPALDASELPPLDLLLITHSHRDHLDEPTVRRLPRTTPVVVPRGLGDFFTRLDFTAVHELEWWQDLEIAGLTVTLVPARHWSRRGLFDLNASLWGGFVLRPADVEPGSEADVGVYHAGDSAYWHGFEDIGRRFPSLDVALMPIGAYRPGWFMEHSHMTPEQAARAFLDVGARHLVPMHWGTFRLTDEPLAEPIERLRRWWQSHRPRNRHLHDLPVGGVLDLTTAP